MLFWKNNFSLFDLYVGTPVTEPQSVWHTIATIDKVYNTVDVHHRTGNTPLVFEL